jgi:hypothetical protein
VLRDPLEVLELVAELLHDFAVCLHGLDRLSHKDHQAPT